MVPTEHAVVVAGGGPTGMMLAAELALAGVDAVIVERRKEPKLDGSRAGGLLMVLAGSASYIAVPAALRYAIPEANPSVYFSMSLGVTVPLNILLGIPAYAWMAGAVLG